MKEIFEQYGGVLITVVAVLAMVALVTFLIGSGDSSAVAKAFHRIMEHFLSTADVSALSNP